MRAPSSKQVTSGVWSYRLSKTESPREGSCQAPLGSWGFTPRKGVRQEVPTLPRGGAPVHHTRSVRTKPGGGQAGRGRRSAPGAGASLFSKGRNKTASSPRRRPIPEVPRPGPSGRAVSVSTLPPCGEPRCSLPRRASRAPVPSPPFPGRVAQVLAQGVPGAGRGRATHP